MVVDTTFIPHHLFGFDARMAYESLWAASLRRVQREVIGVDTTM